MPDHHSHDVRRAIGCHGRRHGHRLDRTGYLATDADQGAPVGSARDEASGPARDYSRAPWRTTILGKLRQAGEKGRVLAHIHLRPPGIGGTLGEPGVVDVATRVCDNGHDTLEPIGEPYMNPDYVPPVPGAPGEWWQVFRCTTDGCRWTGDKPVAPPDSGQG